MSLTALIDSDTVLPKNYHISRNGYAVFNGGGRCVLVHRYIVEQTIGRTLKPTEVVHHINYDKLDNRRHNLLVCPDQAYHKIIHARTDYYNQGVNPDTHHICSTCKLAKEKRYFPRNRDEWNGVNHNCKDCSNLKRRIKQYSKGKFKWLQRLQQQYRRINTSYTKRGICWITKEGKCP